jgi:AAA15 family ATPase/GTPase
MIEKISIKNIYGIFEKQEIDFSLKSCKIREGQNCLEKGILKNKNGDPIMLTPTFIAKNAAGKTSLLKALELISTIEKKGLFL